jgi:hypothetical protein
MAFIEFFRRRRLLWMLVIDFVDIHMDIEV